MKDMVMVELLKIISLHVNSKGLLSQFNGILFINIIYKNGFRGRGIYIF